LSSPQWPSSPGHLEATFSAIAVRYGSIDAYLEKALGFDPAKRAAFEAHLLANP